jgi:peptide-methionine (S)-S-oxide reductase
MLLKHLLLISMCAAAAALSSAAPETKSAPEAALVLGGGCFWCTEAAYELVPGVKSVESGYAGGRVANPTYQQVCDGTTGHAEVIKINYDPQQVTLPELLDLFWVIHDPTTLNRQGADEGTQYRSIVLYSNEEQKAAAEKSKAAAESKFQDPIVTEIVPLGAYYPAEEYHQDYFRKNPNQGYCRAVIRPKIDKLKKVLSKP